MCWRGVWGASRGRINSKDWQKFSHFLPRSLSGLTKGTEERGLFRNFLTFSTYFAE